MKFLCRHRWSEVARKSVPGALETGAPFEFGGGLRNRNTPYILYGYTTIEWRCEKCSKMVMHTGIGTVEEAVSRPEAGKR